MKTKVVEIKQWKNEENGMMLIEERNHDQLTSKFIGAIQLPTKNGLMPFNFPFPDNFTFDQCFEQYEETAVAFLEELHNKEKNRIITPDELAPQNSKQPLPFKLI